MNSFISTVAICLILATELVGGNRLLTYCSKCIENGEVSGYYPHPDRCDSYIHCYIQGDVHADVQECGVGTFFDSQYKVCSSADEVKCNTTCTPGSKFKVSSSCNQYYQCTDNGFDKNIQYCAVNSAFDIETSACVPDTNCPLKEVPLDCSSFVVDLNRPEYYFVAGVEMWCGTEFTFNTTLCTCIHSGVFITPPNVCKLIDLPLTADFTEISAAGRYVMNNNSVIHNGAAYFDGSSYLIIPSFSNNDFKDKIQIDVDFKFETASKKEIAILSNGNCDEAASVSISLINTLTRTPLLKATMKIKDVLQPVTFQIPIIQNAWVKVTFMKNGNTTSLSINGVVVGNKNVAGAFEFIDGSLIIGKSPQMATFRGYMKNLIVSKCPQ